MSNNWPFHTSHNSLPLMRLADFTGMLSVIDELSSEEFASACTFPHVDSGLFTRTNLAPWHLLSRKAGWEAVFHEFIERSANWLRSWCLWVKWNTSLVVDPFATLEPIPFSTNEFEYIATVMPVSLVPRPA